MYYKNRGPCKFNNCFCKKHILLKGTEICSKCKHGSCWHDKISIDKYSNNNFVSPRKSAQKGDYVIIINTPPIEEYCKCLEDLPA